MKKLILIFLPALSIILFSDFIYGQSKEKQRKFSLGLNFSPDYCYRSIKYAYSPRSNYAQVMTARDNRDESPKLGFTTGINIVWHIHKRFSLEPGMLFSDRGERMNKLPVKIYKHEFSQEFERGIITRNIHYYYLDFPLKANIYLLTGKTKLYFSGGYSTNIYLYDRITNKLEYEDRRIEKYNTTIYDPVVPINSTVIGGIGLSIDLSERLFVRLEPTYRHSLQTNSYYSPERYLYSAGLNFGISYKLQNSSFHVKYSFLVNSNKAY